MKIRLFLIAFVGLSLLSRSHAQDDVSYKVIVNAANPILTMTKDQISKLFLKKAYQWKEGTPALPVDLVETSPVRRKFTKDIHGKAVASIKAYWQQRIFSGREVPPPEKGSEKEVLEYVQAHPGAIGYVSENAPVENVKCLSITK